MSLFGNFDEIPLPDLFSLIMHSTGKLEVWSFSRTQHYELYFHNGHIIYLTFNESNIADRDQAESFVKELIKSNNGDFDFIRGERKAANFKINVEGILLSGLTMADEILSLQEHFPEPETVFVTTSKNKGWLDSDLQEFWKNASPYLKSGASASDLFQHLGLYMDQILLRLYKLRAAWFIEPLRAAADSSTKSIPGNVQVAVNETAVRQEQRTSLKTSNAIPNQDLHAIAASLKPIWQDDHALSSNKAGSGNNQELKESPVLPPMRRLKPVLPSKADKLALDRVMQSIRNLMAKN